MDGLESRFQVKRERQKRSAPNLVIDACDRLERVVVESQPRLVSESSAAIWQYPSPGAAASAQ
ncbi:MAG: hypothetical protein NZ699_04690 [Roseiflexus sp.]|nr:hypothetical protein [Roseiflexus sp.]MCS7288411.1 hypothetical protein [Roseiflexus sp.]MDW8231160.1 hypothetical protein [Roseiflexaceae bacterium]